MSEPPDGGPDRSHTHVSDIHVVPADTAGQPPVPVRGPALRRHRMLGTLAGIAVVGVVLAGLVFVRAENAGRSTGNRSAPTGTATALRTDPVEPTRLALPPLRTALPERITVAPPPSTTLTAAPVRRALALVQTRVEDRVDTPVLVLGDDAKLRVLDVGDLRPAADEDGNEQPALDLTSLSPDGTQAAFAQRDKVVVVDLTTARVRALPVPGPNEHVTWVGRQLVVAQAATAALVDPATGARQAVRYAGPDVAAGPTGTVLELTGAAGGGGPPRLRRWAGTTPDSGRELTGIADFAGWSGPAWSRENRLARAYIPRAGADGPPRPLVVAIDITTGSVVRALDRSIPESGSVLGWLDAHTVLIEGPLSGREVVAWDVNTGTVKRVTELVGATATVALSIP